MSMPTKADLEVNAAKAQIQRFRTLGDYKGGSAYFHGIHTDLQHNKTIAIEIAQLYLVQGHYTWAAQACAAVAPPLFPENVSVGALPDGVLEEENVALEMCRAYIAISNRGDLEDALRVAKLVHAVWLAPNGKDESNPPSNRGTSHADCHKLTIIRTQYESLHNSKGGHDIPIDEHRVLIEFYYHRIMVVAAEQGLLDVNQVKLKAVEELAILQFILESRHRLREARYLVYFRTSLLSDLNDPNVPLILKKFLALLINEETEVEKAMTLVDLGRWYHEVGSSESLAEAQECLSEATKLFQKTQHKYGELDVQEVKLTTARETDSEDIFRRKQDLAEKYFAADCYQNGIRVLIFAISSTLSIQRLDVENQTSIDRLQTKVQEVGGELLKQLVFVHIISAAILKAPEYGRALRSLEGYWVNLPRGIGPINHAGLAMLLFQIYSKLGDLDKALEFARENYDISEKGHSYVNKSDAASTLALAYSQYSRLYNPGSPDELEWLQRSISWLKRWIDRDAKAGFEEGEQEKCFRLAELEDYLSRMHGLKDATQNAQEWLERGKRIGQAIHSELTLNSVVDAQVSSLVRNGNYEEALAASTEACQKCQQRVPFPVFQLAQCFSRDANTRHMYYKNQLAKVKTTSSFDWTSAKQNLFVALEMAFKALQLYRRTRGVDLIVNCTNHLWLLVQEIAMFSNEQAKQLSEGLLYELQETEAFCDSVRRSASASEPMKSLMEKRMFVSNKEHLKLYSAGVQTCLRLNNAASAWLWTQKGKARALSDAFGYRALVPEHLMHLIENEPKLLELYEAEREASSKALNAAPEAYIGATRLVDKIRGDMMQIPILKQVIALREGAFDVGIEDIEFQDSLMASGLAKSSIKYVDWFVPRGIDGRQETIYLFIRQLGGITSGRKLPIVAGTVKQWIQRTFSYPEGAEPPLSRRTGNRLLAEMNGLIDGLNELTSPDDLLILSPADFLHRIPLHGLKIGGRTLIDRNLITYSSSSAVLRHCLIRANTKLKATTEARKKTFFAVYEELSVGGKSERDKIYENVGSLAAEASGLVYTGTQATKDVFEKQCQSADWIHYHGHAFSTSKDVLQSALVLSNGTQVADCHEPDDLASGARQENLTVAEIFNLPMTDNAPHFNIIACDSGTQDIAAGDEPLGIISAMLFAGATSVLGCLWPIESFAGRMCSASFYRNQQAATTTTQSGSQSRQVINLAHALRLAVRDMCKDEKTKQPYYWAPFVLHGSWFWVSGSGMSSHIET